jgi:hypothetical protein
MDNSCRMDLSKGFGQSNRKSDRFLLGQRAICRNVLLDVKARYVLSR